MLPEKLLTELHAIQLELGEYSLVPYEWSKRKKSRLTPAELAERTGCGLAAAHLVLNVMPLQCCDMDMNEFRPFISKGLDGFVEAATSWAAVYVRQGFVPVMTDSAGNEIFVHVSGERLEPIVLLDHYEAVESQSLSQTGVIYKGSLSSLLKKSTDPDYEMFRYRVSWKQHPVEKMRADAAWAEECRRRDAIAHAYQCPPPVIARTLTEEAAIRHAVKMVAALKTAIERYAKGRALPHTLSCWKGVDTLTTTGTEDDLIDILMARDVRIDPKRVIYLKNPPVAAVRDGLLTGGIFEDGVTLGICDPWGNPYHVLLDTDYDGRVPNPEFPRRKSAALETAVAVWSAGPDGDAGTWHDNICSWK